MKSGWTEVRSPVGHCCTDSQHTKVPQKTPEFLSFGQVPPAPPGGEQTNLRAATNLRARRFLGDRPEGVHHRDVAQPPGDGQSAVPIL